MPPEKAPEPSDNAGVHERILVRLVCMQIATVRSPGIKQTELYLEEENRALPGGGKQIKNSLVKEYGGRPSITGKGFCDVMQSALKV